MTLAELVRDGRTTIDAKLLTAIDQQAFRDDHNRLARYAFWKAGSGTQLWDHQKAAIGTIVAYLNADKKIPERPEQTEAALLKLPTGTGKSGIIAVVARCLPRIRRVREETQELLGRLCCCGLKLTILFRQFHDQVVKPTKLSAEFDCPTHPEAASLRSDRRCRNPP